ncbi:hypothetical protein [Streptomyces sp. NPDC048612]|uniref:hypothetical protein n=1 Tax=Streptomyces sp. NPDC048612 TaxID=3365579 RepID=UPI003719C894
MIIDLPRETAGPSCTTNEGQVLADQMQDVPLVDRMWFSKQCGAFTCGCDQDSLAGDPAIPGP